MYKIVCPQCHNEIETKDYRQIFCSVACRGKFYSGDNCYLRDPAGIARRSGKNHWNFGRKHREMMGDKNPAKRPEVRKKISKSKMGKGNAAYGKPSHRRGIRMSKEQIAKIRLSWTPQKRAQARLDARRAEKTGNSKGDYYNSPLQGTVWLRSSYEIAFARWLDAQNIAWLYEPKAFDLGKVSYIPDFYLVNEDKYIEIKGYMRPKAKEKIALFKEKHSHVALVVLDTIALKEKGVI